jgi:hypothetical protein
MVISVFAFLQNSPKKISKVADLPADYYMTHTNVEHM